MVTEMVTVMVMVRLGTSAKSYIRRKSVARDAGEEEPGRAEAVAGNRI